jgi:acyl-CoA reductase-like NAD-dependent aldehyde dehydrogenase
MSAFLFIPRIWDELELMPIGRSTEMRIVSVAAAFGEIVFITEEVTTTKQGREEIFGPCVVIIPFENEDEGIRIANDTTYGLGAGLHSKGLSRPRVLNFFLRCQHVLFSLADADQIMRVGQQLKAGTVWINNYTLLSNAAPFGGSFDIFDLSLSLLVEFTDVSGWRRL